jgi:3-oxoacyl-[acyl-carrier-protein] synthase-1
MQPISIQHYTLTCAAGTGMDAIRQSIATGRSGLSNIEWPECELNTFLGRVLDLDSIHLDLPPEWISRNNRLAELGLNQDGFSVAVENIKAKYGSGRCGLVIGTSTSSIGRTEEAYKHLDANQNYAQSFQQEYIHNPHAPGAYVQHRLDIQGPALTISTACSSSAKVFATATRWLEQGLADAVVIGGVDSLCQSIMHGFNSLQLVDTQPCKPFDVNRGGISLGEAAGFAIVTRASSSDAIHLLGYGESSDAFHMSSAHPQGLGAKQAIDAALARAEVPIDQLDYVNLHGTGTKTNDDIEAQLCQEIFDAQTIYSSTKGWTGHTLGAAGICEAVLTIDALRTGIVPGNINSSSPDPRVAKQLVLDNSREQAIRYALSNSFGFGGNNCSLVFGRT